MVRKQTLQQRRRQEFQENKNDKEENQKEETNDRKEEIKESRIKGGRYVRSFNSDLITFMYQDVGERWTKGRPNQGLLIISII
jgi:alpha-galactosidase/6-phospho-beta-glucosidase family protein